MKNVLITGAKGFIGSQLFKRFNNDKYYNIMGWGLTSGFSDGVKIDQVDMRNLEDVLLQLKSFMPDIVIHCAGSADVAFSVKNPVIDYNGNVTITHNLLFALHRLCLDKVRFVYLSSAGVYGNPIHLPIKETMDLNPLSPYAVHKVMCETLCKYFCRNYKMDIKIARIFSAYGVGLKKQIFWDMYNKYKRTGELKMLGNGSESRDYIYIDDVIQCLFMLATEESDDLIFNIANGEEVTIREATDKFAEAFGIDKSKIAFNGVVREGDPLNWKADITRITKLGYKKTVDMDEGLRRYCAWIKKISK